MRWYKCTICGNLYRETELVIDPDIGLICQRCRSSMKELDQEQEDLETMMREERKMKAGIY